MAKKTVSLVLSSGGARGMAHIGAIEALEESGYEIVSIAGSSAGALIGGIYSTGQLDTFKNWICNLDKIDVFSLMDFTISRKGFIKGEKVFNALKSLIEDCEIEKLKIPFACNAVKIPSGEEKIFTSGSLYEAIRASISIPTVLTPSKIGEDEYIDGGIINPLPFNLIKPTERGNLLVVVDLNGPKSAFESPSEKEKKESNLKLPMWLSDYQKKFSNYFYTEQKEEKPKGLSSVELLNYSFDLIQDKLSEMIIRQHDIDLLVEVSREQAGTLEFHRAAELIEIGKKKMGKAIKKFESGNKRPQ
ncbi:UPF0028 protein YchK [Indibacter alkaliphilus LW1]|uniref:UPF0028 protein YchK n=1 Tax=Indibacter alkaliphilus (strain CCUG 57479 / KCTC 22604 / LW1) TaxID=1189612 RepID=S2DJV2_INDAL|nr:patatin-like phospholipase family protein [Indibacter alkaliphilus]EOZ92271.1 UPF0028 protein YchK [Indibacter alkaliphilus LW1]